MDYGAFIRLNMGTGTANMLYSKRNLHLQFLQFHFCNLKILLKYMYIVTFKQGKTVKISYTGRWRYISHDVVMLFDQLHGVDNCIDKYKHVLE